LQKKKKFNFIFIKPSIYLTFYQHYDM